MNIFFYNSKKIKKNIFIFFLFYFILLAKLTIAESFDYQISTFFLGATIFAVLILVSSSFFRKSVLVEVGKNDFGKNFFMYLSFGLILGGIQDFLFLIFPESDGWGSSGVKWHLPPGLAYVFMIMIMAIFEEILFRDILYKTLIWHKILFSGLITDIFFSILHLPVGIPGFLNVFIAGYVLNMIYLKKKSWILNSVAHIGLNCHVYVERFLLNQNIITRGLEGFFGALFFVIFVLFYFGSQVSWNQKKNRPYFKFIFKEIVSGLK